MDVGGLIADIGKCTTVAIACSYAFGMSSGSNSMPDSKKGKMMSGCTSGTTDDTVSVEG